MVGAAVSADLGWGVNNRNPDGALEIRHEGQKPNGSGLFLNKATWTFMSREGKTVYVRFRRDFEPE